MTETQAKKHREVIKRFVDAPEKGVWCKSVGAIKEWNIVKNPTFYEDRIYVTNDEWADISKQFIDDPEKVEYLHGSNWIKTMCATVEGIRYGNIKEYRIKPKEPEFKVGDWVIMTPIGNYPETIHRIVKIEEGRNYCFLERYTCMFKVLRLWKPEKNNLVVFWDNDIDDEYIVRKYAGMKENKHMDVNEILWDNVAPLELLNKVD